MNKLTTIELKLLLPDVPDAHDACVGRLESLLGQGRGISRAHVLSDQGRAPTLCLHYDPDVVTLAQVERLARAAGARVTERFGHAVVPLRLVGGEDAARRVEAELAGMDGVLGASVSLPAQFARVEFDRERTSLEQIERALREISPPVSAREGPPPAVTAAGPKEGGRPESWYARHRELAWSLIAGIILAVAWAGARWTGLPRGLAVALYAASYAFGGFDLVRHAARSLREGRFYFDIDLLMLLAALGAAVLGQWAEGAFLLFLFSLAHALEHYALSRARGAIRALAELAPPVARVLKDGGEREVPVEQVAAGEVVVVRPAERIPVDGTVRSGRSAVNQAPITGESVPVEKGPGAEVFAGTINGEGALEVTVSRAAGDRTLDRVVRLVEEAQTQKAPTQQFTDRFEAVFVPAVLVADILLIVLPPVFGWWSWGTSFYRGMALLVAASPCALALGTPSAVLAGIRVAAQ